MRKVYLIVDDSRTRRCSHITSLSLLQEKIDKVVNSEPSQVTPTLEFVGGQLSWTRQSSNLRYRQALLQCPTSVISHNGMRLMTIPTKVKFIFLLRLISLNQPVGQAVTRSSLKREVRGSNLGPVKSDTRHPCNISSKGPVDHTQWMLHTVSSIAERQARKLLIPTLMFFGLTQLGIGMGISEYRIQKDPNSKLSGIQIEL